MHVLWKHFEDGGWGMYPILVWSILAVALFGERAIFLFLRAPIHRDRVLMSLKGCVLAGDIRGAIRWCCRHDRPVTRIVRAGLLSAARPSPHVQVAMDAAALQEFPRLSARTAYLPVLANLSIYSGMLGTINGLVFSFGSVGGESVDPGQKARILAERLSEAINCTAFGLAVAILCVAAYSLLQGRTYRLLDDIHVVSVQLMNLVVANREKIDLRPVLPGGCSNGPETRKIGMARSL